MRCYGFWVRSTYHTALQAMSDQLVFGCDMILNAPFISDWEAIKIRKKKIIDRNNQIENKTLNRTYIEYGIKY